MAFQETGIPFDRIGVSVFAPDALGCYGIYDAAGWVYIGQGNIRDRLLAHLMGDGNPFIRYYQPAWFVFEEGGANLAAREAFYIALYQPVCNRQVG